MKNDSHIIDILDSAPLGNLSEAQLIKLRKHLESCASCARSYDAAALSSQMLHARVAVEVEPSPFFATKVLATIREQRGENMPVMLRLWRSASYLVSSMAITTAALAVLSFVVPGPAVGSSDSITTASSAESVIFGDEEQLSYEQVLSTIYEDEEEAK
jgi:predicted anti-sigma-YlaC factor YlaD